MIASIAFLSQAAVPPAMYPAHEVLGAFSTVCGDTRSIEAIDTAAVGSGWEPAIVEAETPMAKVLEFANSSARTKAFTRRVSGRALHAMAYQSTGEVKCVVYDFDALAPLEEVALIDWAKKPPTRRSHFGPLEMFIWEPGTPISADRVSSAFAAPDNSARDLGLIGVAISAQSNGKSQ